MTSQIHFVTSISTLIHMNNKSAARTVRDIDLIVKDQNQLEESSASKYEIVEPNPFAKLTLGLQHRDSRAIEISGCL